MRILARLLILALALGGVVAACADEHTDQADPDCVGDCCQPGLPGSVGAALLVSLSVRDRLIHSTDGPNDDPLVRVPARPPAVA